MAVAAPGVSAFTPLNDMFEGTNLGKAFQPSPFTYAPGVHGLGALFAAPDSNIHYSSSYFGAQGTVSFFLQADAVGERSIIGTVGASTAMWGDLRLILRSNNTLRLYMYDGAAWHRLTGTTVIDRAYVTLSYGPTNGMKLYVNGASEGAYSGGNYLGTRNGKNVYLGDCPLDGASYQWGLSGGIDTLRTSDVECDENLIYGAAAPEPGSLLALATGLLGSVAAFRRRRK